MSTQSTAVKEPDTLEYRLPRNVIPSCYEIRLSPDLENFTFAGEVKNRCAKYCSILWICTYTAPVQLVRIARCRQSIL